MNNALDLKTLADEEVGDAHLMSSVETPMRKDAFELSDEEKKQKIASHFTEIMNTLGLDLNDDSLKGTPNRVAKMFVQEIFSGLNPKNKPKIAVFDNKYHRIQLGNLLDICYCRSTCLKFEFVQTNTSGSSSRR